MKMGMVRWRRDDAVAYVLTRAMTAAEREVTFARAGLADTETTLEQALIVASNCWRHYEAAPAFIRTRASSSVY